jgi:hypothetical protein
MDYVLMNNSFPVILDIDEQFDEISLEKSFFLERKQKIDQESNSNIPIH